MDDKNCTPEHTQILNELARINKRMDEDWPLIKSSYEDRIRREGIWNVLKYVGFSGITGLLIHLLQK